MKKILIVEDDPSAKQIYRDFLDRFKNLELYEESDGEAGFETAKKILPDLIVLDNRMPNLSGEQAAKKLKAEPSTSSIPVVMITAMALDKRQIDLIKLDVNEFIQHPFSPWLFQSTLEKYLGPLAEISLDSGE